VTRGPRKLDRMSCGLVVPAVLVMKITENRLRWEARAQGSLMSTITKGSFLSGVSRMPGPSGHCQVEVNQGPLEGGFSEELIVARIKTSAGDYQLGTDALMDLRNGVFPRFCCEARKVVANAAQATQ
jgi:hypothetical protein